MVFGLHRRTGSRPQALIALSLISGALTFAAPVQAASEAGTYLSQSQELYKEGQFFKAARYAFAAQEADASLQPEAYSWVTLGLVKAGLYNAASYFFIKTLQSGNRTAVRRVLTHTQDLLVRSGADLLRKYLIRHTTYEDYDSVNRSAYLYSLGKEALLAGKEVQAIGYLNGISPASAIWPFALQLRGSALAIAGHNNEAIRDFQECVSSATKYSANVGRGEGGFDAKRARETASEAEDLQSRCVAGEARTLYQMEKFDEADRTYDRIPKESLVWPDILFEQAWNSFGRQQYNRTLGKLVSYKSPALTFVFNSETDVLRAQTYLALCLYTDANEVINEFNARYTKVGEEVKHFVEGNANNLPLFYETGKKALHTSLYTSNHFYSMMNRFVRGPYFQNLVAAERALGSETQAIQRWDMSQPGVTHSQGQGFPGFLHLVLQWRLKTIQLLGGAFVKNSLVDYHASLISDFEKMAFIKLEMLSRAKEKLLYNNASSGERARGNVRPSRRDDQYFWTFNGEFWTDELGDYVFGLESECSS